MLDISTTQHAGAPLFHLRHVLPSTAGRPHLPVCLCQDIPGGKATISCNHHACAALSKPMQDLNQHRS